jgi:hypothetical protein
MRQAVIASPLTHPVRRIDPALRPAAVKFTEGLFARLAEWCRSRSITLLVTNGNFLEFAAKPQAPGATAMFIETAASFFARLGVPYLSVARAHGPLAGPPQSLEIPGDGHPNERGARLIADAVWPWLNEQLQPIVEPRTISQPDM